MSWTPRMAAIVCFFVAVVCVYLLFACLLDVLVWLCACWVVFPSCYHAACICIDSLFAMLLFYWSHSSPYSCLLPAVLLTGWCVCSCVGCVFTNGVEGGCPTNQHKQTTDLQQDHSFHGGASDDIQVVWHVLWLQYVVVGWLIHICVSVIWLFAGWFLWWSIWTYHGLLDSLAANCFVKCYSKFFWCLKELIVICYD